MGLFLLFGGVLGTAEVLAAPTPDKCFQMEGNTIKNYYHWISDCGKQVEIPHKINGTVVKAIGKDAFKNKGLINLTFPSNSQITAI